MRFGPVPLSEAVGLISAHTLRSGEATLRKGTPITPDMARRLEAEGVRDVVAVALDGEDVGEDEAAARLAAILAGDNLRCDPAFTGRCNLFATRPGLLLIDVERITAVNGVDEAITVASLPAFKPVTEGEMVATVKIIPYAVPASALAAASTKGQGSALRVAPYRRRRVAVVSTRLPSLKDTTIDKTLRVLAERLAPTGRGSSRRPAWPTPPRPSPTGSSMSSGRVRRIWPSFSAPRPSPTGATSSPWASNGRAAGWTISGCRSIPAISCFLGRGVTFR